ncbi:MULTISPECIES: Crp/Fnr family transcriptional regulator [Paenibacillus]|uniref:Cyclic nucleotide-binding domain-containing protein n=1 Tax=Paenibacillus naphthalenovorans TaxID=162209 RepID=A0A0U2VX35_9BACL|nr:MULTISPECIES: Crp/Fnr family transcriptional regulator [Paenibacillus]ALS24039.1 cyclic nucleotide-binding domain-containing protein [Paenibacillus naphthalenovorans]GCL72269.1 Crp/Fnr family transcriptional regulator [Paenibacillus naphthalenovorans]
MDVQYVIDEAFHPRHFGPLPPEVSEAAAQRFFPRGSNIIFQGEPAEHFFYVHTGQVRATIIRPDGIEKAFAFAERGQFFADVPFFQQSNHWYTVVAVESTQVSEFSRESMETITRVRPDFVFSLMQSIAHKVWMLSNQMMTLTFDPTEVRLARIVVEILNRKPEGFRSLAITHQELSALTGTSRVMVTRVLNDWRARGIVELRKRTLCVMDLPALERIAAFGME